MAAPTQATDKQAALQAHVERCRRMLANGEDAVVYNEMAVSLARLHQLDAAMAAHRRSLELDPDNPTTLSNMAATLRATGELDEALSVLHRLLEKEEGPIALFNLGMTHQDLNNTEEALAAFTAALRLNPELSQIHLEMAQVLIQAGRWPEGFAMYERRFEYNPTFRLQCAQPMWDGAPLKGKTLLLYADQGLGDALMCLRYIPLIDKRGGKIIVICDPSLHRIVSMCEGVDEVLEFGGPAKTFDCHLPLFSLPHRFGATVENVPNAPYIQVPEDCKPVTLTVPEGTRLKVGIVWGCGNKFKGLRDRAIELRHFLTLLEIPGVQLYSLQKGPHAEALSTSGANKRIEDLGSACEDFGDTAAALAELDLLISSDTSVVHLAGAMGKPAWVILPYASEWRWLKEREDTPWYPRVRLFRQDRPRDWEAQFQRVRNALAEQLA